MKRLTRTIVLLLILSLLAGCAGEVAQTQPDPLVIAVLAPLSEEYELLGQSLRNGVVLAVEEWNQRGVLRRPIQIVLLDTECNFETAYEVAEAAIKEHGTYFIIGGVCSVASEAIAQVASEEGAIQISPASADPDILLDNQEDLRPFVFALATSDPLQATLVASYTLETLEAETAAIFYDQDSSYGLVLANAFEAAFTAGDGEVLAREVYDREDENFFDVLEEIRDAEVDVLYLPGYYEVAQRLVPQIRAYGINATIVGSDGWDSPLLERRRVDGSYFAVHYYPAEPRPQVEIWQEKYRTRYIVDPNVLAALGYDATNILLATLHQAGTLDPLTVAARMERMTYEVVTGRVDYDEGHGANTGMVLLQVQGGDLVYVDRLLPE